MVHGEIGETMGFDLKGLRVYLSGPMTGIDDYNAPAFAEAERWCLEMGAKEVFNPAMLAPMDGKVQPHERYMARTLNELTKNGYRDGEWFVPDYDLVLLLDGWWRSEGANCERMVARACGIEAVEMSEAREWSGDGE